MAYQALRPWRLTVVIVGHGRTLRNFHDYLLDVSAFNPSPECQRQS
jgi:ABC-type uncharacterized transport system fused permease/ATPase subunit